ncbi:MAG TPA: LysR substrate-binding domain-containing protein [Devosia sp.]|nr:LysR substrate-binding domain-containing protein [Devosia sp.]
MTSLPVFEAVGRHLSVARAAEELHLTAGAVSRQVQNLEAFLGLSLFERGHRRIVFTPAGEAYWAKIHTLLSELRDVTRALSADADDRPLVISAPRMFLQIRVMPALGSLYRRHPGMVVRFVTGQPELEGLDGAIFVGAGPRRGFVTEPLAPANLSPVCSPSYLAVAPPLANRHDLARHTLLRSAEYTRNWERWLGPDAAEVFARARFIDFESSGLELTAAEEGLGVAIVRLRLVKDQIDAGRLVALFPEHVVHEHYSFTFAESKLRSPRFRQFRNWLREAVAS